jgi:acylphosphatase
LNTVKHVVIRGRVQGVGFRAFVEDTAERLGVEGWVRNRHDGTVEAVFAGPEATVAEAIEACRHGPRGARVTSLDVNEGEDLLQQEAVRFAVLPTA